MLHQGCVEGHVPLICEAKGDQKSADICTGLAERITLALGWQIVSDEA
ncbi:hypothetical protein HY29_17635 [Hyphomonas beringensis]|uniref:Uncharacterized protein n=1 Tax=Hyphomonas beringensis TaxID=1280946 RepID=A0A062U9D5_9PROT|nr:hypothetical protein HY29_17635 [Hyphomonas beringensis]